MLRSVVKHVRICVLLPWWLAFLVKRIILVKRIWESTFILHTKHVKFHWQMVKRIFYPTEIVGKARIRVRVSFGLVKCIYLVKSAFFNRAHKEEDRDGHGHCLIPEVPGTYPVWIWQLICCTSTEIGYALRGHLSQPLP